MWEAIAANRRRSIWIVAGMIVVMLVLGISLGLYVGDQLGSLRVEFDRDYNVEQAMWQGGSIGGGAALVLALGLWLTAWFSGDRMILRSVRAREIQKHHSPRLWNVVEEMCIAAGLPMPRVYLVEDPSPNAFAVGRDPQHAAVAVTSGLLRMLSRDELQGVVAHEVAHVHNLDIRFMTIAAVLVGSVELLSRTFLEVGPYASAGRRGGGTSKGGGVPVLLLLAFAVSVLSPVLVRLLYLACSRQREYLADASAARFTRYPEGLASALEKIHVHYSGWSTSKNFNGAVAALYIVNPIQQLSAVGLLSTHPPTESRVKVLRAMSGRTGYVDYAAALRAIEGNELRLKALEAAKQSDESVAARQPLDGPETPETAIERAQEVADIVDWFAQYLVVPCACGMRLKIPPDYKREDVLCPRCDRLHKMPTAQPAAAIEGPAQTESTQPRDLQFERRSEGGFETFRCTCGQVIQLGPDYPLTYTVCANCNRRIDLASRVESPVPTSIGPAA